MNWNFLKYLSFFKRTTRSNALKAFIVLIIGLCLSVAVASRAKKSTDAQTYRDYTLACSDMKAKLHAKLQAHAQLLRSGAIYIEASDTITRQAWKQFCEYSRSKNTLMEIQEIGYALAVQYQEKDKHIEKIRKEGFSAYELKPAGKRNLYTPIVYLEPSEGKRFGTIGFDLYSETSRKIAMDMSRDSDIISLSDKAGPELNGNKPQYSTLFMYAPVYHSGYPIANMEQRRKAIKGWVYSSYRMDNLMQGILGRWDSDPNDRIHLEIYNGSTAGNKLYDSQYTKSKAAFDLPSKTIQMQIEFSGRTISLIFSVHNEPRRNEQAFIISAGGTAISLLLAIVSLLLLNTHYRTQLITEQLKEELQESETRFKIMFMQHNSIMLLINPTNGNIIDANISASLFYCYPIPELQAMNLKDIDVQTAEEKEIDRAKAEELNRNFFISKHKLATGEIRLIEDYSSPIEYRGEKTTFSIIHDITDRQRAEKALKDSEERWKFAIEGANDGLWDWNLATNETFFSPQWKAMLGYETNDIKNSFEEWSQRIHPEDKQRSIESIQAHLEGKTHQYSNIHRLACKDGSYKWILDRGKVVSYDANNVPQRMIGTHTDMTERIEMENRLIQVNADKDRFIYILAHDLKNPFNAILGFLEMLVEGVRRYSTDELEKYITAAHQSTLQTYHLLQDLLSWSQAQTNKLPFKPKDIKLEEVYSNIADLLRLSASKKGITMIHLFPEKTSVYADRNMLSTILRNLLTNAIKFSYPGGKITIDAMEKSNELTITISDTGTGINEESLKKLFDTKYLHTTEGTAKERGTGFGLFLCKDFMEKHGGRIQVESEPGKGSAFSISFPNRQQ